MTHSTKASDPKTPQNPWVFEGRHIITYENLNSQGTLFGGHLAQWIDEASWIYAICQMKTKRVVTLRISELLFKRPVYLHEVLEFRCRTARVGQTSLTVETEVLSILTSDPNTNNQMVCAAELQFVAVDEDGRPKPWH